MYLKKYGKLGMGIFFTVLAVGYYILASQLPASTVMKIGPSFVPKIVAVLTFVLGAILTYSGYKTCVTFRREDNAEEIVPSYIHVVLTIVAFGIYVYSLESVGFLLCTFIYLVLQILILSPAESRRPVTAVAISLVATVAIYFIFRQGLTVMLPRGILG